MKKEEIPNCVLEVQKKYGFNSSELIGFTDKEIVFSISLTDENGFSLPTGLPVLVLVSNDNTYRVIQGEEALNLSISYLKPCD